MFSTRIKCILNYELKGKYGWSYYQPNIIDVADIISVSYNERLFCLLDKDFPYTLYIECHNITTETTLAPVITTKGIGLSFVPRNNFKSTITRRFKTTNEINDEINKISHYQNLLDDYAVKIRNELLE